MIKAVIFDMDGLLIDSEPLWKEAEIEVFTSVGVPLTLEMTEQTMGMRTDAVVKYWHDRYPWRQPSQKEIADLIDSRVLTKISQKGVAKAGVEHAFEVCVTANLPVAIASSSSMQIINTVIKKLGLESKVKAVHSAHNEEFGKPHPGVYLSTAKALGVKPEECLALEDSENGIKSAKAAKMKCIAVPEQEMINDDRFKIADLVIASLNEFNADMLRI